MNKTKKLTTAAMMVALMVVISLALYMMPVLFFLTPIIGVPIVIYSKTMDLKTAMLIGLVSLVLMTITSDLVNGVLAMTVAIIPALIQGLMFRKDKPASLTIVYSGVAMFFSLLGLVYGLEMFLDYSVVDTFNSSVDMFFDQIKVVSETMGLYTQDQLIEVNGLLTQMKHVFLTVIPSLLAILCLFGTILMYVVTCAISKRMKIDYKRYYLKDFRINKEGRFIIMLVMIAVTIVYYFDKSNGFYYVSNFFVLFTMILRFNALGFLWYLAERHPNKKAMKVVVVSLYIIPGIIPGFQIIAYLTAILGFVDMYADLRKRIEAKSK